jgi:hypothetical protein
MTRHELLYQALRRLGDTNRISTVGVVDACTVAVPDATIDEICDALADAAAAASDEAAELWRFNQARRERGLASDYDLS